MPLYFSQLPNLVQPAPKEIGKMLQLGVVEWCLGARCVPKRCLHWKKTYNQISEQPLQKRTAIAHIGTF